MVTWFARASQRVVLGAWTLIAASSAVAQQHVGSAGSAGIGGAKAPSLRPPNPLDVLIIVVDDVGMDQFGAYASAYVGTPVPCTPELDELAARSVRFTNCWASPVCTPTRAMVLTGRPPSRIGTGTVTKVTSLVQNGVPPDVPTIADVFQSQASAIACTAAVGKWHLADPGQLPNHPLDLGFAAWSGSYFNLNVSSTQSPDCFDTSYCDWCKNAVDGLGGFTFPHHANYATVDTTDDALVALAQLQGLSIPWFLYVAYNSTHAPFECPQNCAQPCPNTTCGWCTACPATGDDFAATRAMTEVLDAEIGRLLEHIDFSRTAVIVIADNGTQPSAVVPPFDPFHAKVSPYQGGINVPLIVWTPRCAATGGRTCHELVSASDLFATAADFAQLVLPPDTLVDSVSLAQYVDERYDLSGAVPRQYVYSEMFDPHFVPDSAGAAPADYTALVHIRAVRNGRYKLIEKNRYDPTSGSHGNGTSLELYQLSNGLVPDDPAFGPDPFELHDLLEGPAPLDVEQQAALDELRFVLQDRYPVLRTGFRATGWRAAVQDAAGTNCAVGPLTVGHWVDGSGDTHVARSFLDFDLSSLPIGALVLDAVVDLELELPAGSPDTEVTFAPMSMPTTMYSCDAVQGLFDAASAQSWGSVSHWQTPGVAQVSSLGAAAGLHAATVVCDAASAQTVPIFSLALRFTVEAPPVSDQLVLADPSGPLRQLIRVFYAAGAPTSCP